MIDTYLIVSRRSTSIIGSAERGPQMVVGNPVLDIGMFAVLVVVTFAVATRAGRRPVSGSDVTDPSFGGPRTGVPVAGDQFCAVALLGLAGAVAVYGDDGFLYAVAFLAAWLMALLLIAELVGRPGRFVRAPVLAERLQRRPVRAATAATGLAVSFLSLLAQTVAATTLVSLVADIPDDDTVARAVATAVTGSVMTVYVLLGGLRTTAAARLFRAGSLLVVVAVLVAWVMGSDGGDLRALTGSAGAAHVGGPAAGDQLLAGLSGLSKIDLLSAGLALVLGGAGLPHVLRRLSVAPGPGAPGGTRRRSAVWGVALTGLFCLFAVVLGYGAATRVPGGAQGIVDAPGASNAAAPLLAYAVGGVVLLALVSAVAFATILDAAAGLTITASVAFAHDIRVRRGGPARPTDEIRVARRTAVVLGVVVVVAGFLARDQNVALLAVLAFAVAASANLATVVLSLFWRRFTDHGALWSSYGGSACSVVLIVFSPTVSGQPGSLFPGVDLALFPLADPGLVSVPFSFALGVAGSYLGGRNRARALARIAARQAVLDRDPPTEAIEYDPVARVRAARQLQAAQAAAVGPADAAEDADTSTRPLPTAS